MTANGAKITSDALFGLRRFIESNGLDFLDLCRRFDLDPRTFPSEEDFIPLDLFARMLEFLRLKANDDSFGLRFAAASQSRPVGMIYYMGANALNLREFLDARLHFSSLVATGYAMDLLVEGETARLSWKFADIATPHDQLIDFLVSFTVGRIRILLDEHWRPREVWLAHPAAPRTQAAFQQILGAVVRFSRSPTCLIFDAADLSKSFRHPNPHLFRSLERAAESTNMASDETVRFGDIVAAVLAKQLPKGNPKVDLVARELGMSRRTLQRRLDDEKTTYRRLVAGVRKRAARNLLTFTDLPIIEVGAHVGFADTGSFSRAIKNWYGCTPGELRAASRLHA